MRKAIYITLISLAVLVILFSTTNPNKVPSLLLVLPFILLFLLIWSILYLGLRMRGMGSPKAIRTGALVTIVPLSLLVLQSIGQLTVKDAVVLLVFFGLAYFYISRTGLKSSP